MAEQTNAKIQNLVYNKPINVQDTRPQELLIRNSLDSYEITVSCVAPIKTQTRRPVKVDVRDDKLIALYEDRPVEGVEIMFVKEPEYYRKKLHNGLDVKKFVSACGLDELNIFPWKGCAISKCLRSNTNRQELFLLR